MDVISPLDAVDCPIETARGLPNAHYTSLETYRHEVETLLFATWTAVGFAQDLREGEAMPLNLAGQPLLAVRGRAGELRVFQNVCRHRGMTLVDRKRQVGGVIRCPYHSWCYALTGELVATPHVGGPGHNIHPGIDRASLGLVEVRSHVWRDVIFVNVDGQAADFEEHTFDARRRWADFEPHRLFAGADSRFSFDVGCNWKLAVENYCESYHLPWVHPGLNSYSRLEDHYDIQCPDRFSGQATRVYNPMIQPDGRRFPDFPGLSERWASGAEYISLYPNLLLGVHRDHAFAIILEPHGPARTVEQVALYYATEQAASGPEWSDMRSRNRKMWHEVFSEDLFVVEGMQQGRQARGFDGGRFSPAMDGPTHDFHRWVARRMHGTASLGS